MMHIFPFLKYSEKAEAVHTCNPDLWEKRGGRLETSLRKSLKIKNKKGWGLAWLEGLGFNPRERRGKERKGRG